MTLHVHEVVTNLPFAPCVMNNLQVNVICNLYVKLPIVQVLPSYTRDIICSFNLKCIILHNEIFFE